MSLSTIFYSIKERIQNHIPQDEMSFIYIGVGTYAGLKNNNGILELQNYHQFPPFLQDVKNRYPELNLFIVLIDPMQEKPPYMVADKGLIPLDNSNSNPLDNNNPLDNTTIFTTNDRKLIVYTLRQSVYTEPYECYGDAVNITEDLRDLNNYVMRKNITLLYHDFTGRRNSWLAEYFDKEIGEHLNHVIYGMSAREDHGCYFDLTDIGAYFPITVRKEEDPPAKMLLLFNIYNYIVNNKINLIESESSLFEQEIYPMINKQIEQVITTVKEDLKNHMLTLLRVVFRLNNGDEKQADINIDHCFNFIKKSFREEYLNLYKTEKYNQLYSKLIDYFSRDFDIIAKLKKYDLTGKEILGFITHGDKPYEWYNNINMFL